MTHPASRRGRVAGTLALLDGNAYLSAIRAGMVSVVPLTIVGSAFMVAAHLPIARWQAIVDPYRSLLEVPVTATFGVLAIVACFSMAYELGRHHGQDALASASMATVTFLMIQIDPARMALIAENLGARGLFTAIVVALVTVAVQRVFTDRGMVIRLPASVPPVVVQSFVALTPLACLIALFWSIRFVAGVDITGLVQAAFTPLVFALNTLPGILIYACLVTGLWSVGINGDNAVDTIVAPIFLQYLAANVAAMTAGQPLPYATAYGFFTTFVNVGGTGATIALALVLLRSPAPQFRQVSRLSLPTQVFQINEPIFFGLPIVLNPVFMIPYVLCALLLTAGTYLLMSWGIVQKPFVNVPWTTPPIVGHYLVTGGDWRAAVWGVCSIVMAMLVYLPFARLAERRAIERMRAALQPPEESR